MWTKAQAQAKFLAAAATIRFLIARPPCRPASGHYYITAAERGATADHCGIAEEEAEEGQRKISEEDRLALPLITSSSSSETSPRSRDSGNMSIDSDKSFEGTRNRLSSSSSSKDSGHRSSGGAGSIDRSTTNSSKSEASSLEGSVQSDPGRQQQQQQQKIDGIAGDLKKSQSLFSIDSDFMFVSTKNDQPDDRSMLSIRPGNHHNPLVFRKDYINNNNNNNNHHQLIGDNRNNPLMTIIDPIYEMISEQSEAEADMYCLPVDSMRPSAVAATAVGVTSSSGKPVFNNSKMAAAAASPEHVGKKTRSRSSDQVKMLAKSASGNHNYKQIKKKLSILPFLNSKNIS
jgi:hypothetical protein